MTIHADLDQLGAAATFGELSTQGAIERAVFELLREPSAGRRVRRRPATAAA